DHAHRAAARRDLRGARDVRRRDALGQRRGARADARGRHPRVRPAAADPAPPGHRGEDARGARAPAARGERADRTPVVPDGRREVRRRGIGDERVLAAMGEVPRERFLAPEFRTEAYRDGAVAIAEGQTMSQPWIVARMTSLLDLRGHERVLEVGTGSGYGAAVLAMCAAEVVTIERHERLAESARSTLERLGFDNVEVRVGDGSRGAPDRAPF